MTINQATKGMVCALAVAMLATGCSSHRRWGMCALGGGLLGATAGGVGTGVIRFNAADHKPSDRTMTGVTAAGAATGGLIGALLGHYICDPVDEPVAQAAPAPTPPPAGTKIGELKGAHFAFDSATLTAEGEARMVDTVQALKDYPTINVVCAGHTDSVGSDAYNMKLGQRRADAVRDYLVSQGIDAGRIRTESFGEGNPIASNDTAEGRAENRRVEIVVE